MFNFIRVLSLVQGSGWEFLCFLLHTIRLQVRKRRRGWRSPTAEYGVDGGRRQHGRWFALENRIHWLLPAGVREPNRSAGCFSASFRSKVRARKPNSLALPAGVREPNQSAGCFSASFRSRVRARKPNSLALPAGVREPNQSAGCFSASFRSRVRARKPNSLALPAGVREPNQSAAPVLARSDEGTRACGVQCANREGRAPGKRRRGWRGPTKGQGLAGCKAPTWKAARREKGAGVGAVRRRNKGLWGARRQHGRPRSVKTAPGLARSDEGTRACGVQGANREGRAPGKRRRGWRGPTEEQGLVGGKAPTGKAARPHHK